MEKTQIEKNAIYTLVVGLGVTGLSVVRYLRSLGERVVVVDSRDLPPGMNELKEKYPDVELHTGKFKPALFTSARRIVVSPGVPMSEPALKKAREQGYRSVCARSVRACGRYYRFEWQKHSHDLADRDGEMRGH